MKVLVIGNCQARPLAEILSRNPRVIALTPIILHLSQTGESEAHEEQMAKADLILAQYTTPAFKPDHLAAETVAGNWRDKVLIWPNLFYSGQQPFLRYLTHPEFGRLLGPFDAVHDLRYLLEWYAHRSGRSPAKDFDRQETVEEIRVQSIATLRDREANCDVLVSDLIEAHERKRRLFFTFNHPTRWLLEALCQRIAARAGFDLPLPQDEREPLGQIIPPSLDLIEQNENGGRQNYSGRQVVLQPKGVVTVTGSQSYTAQSVREMAFRCFDHIAPHLDFDALRMTPILDADPRPVFSSFV